MSENDGSRIVIDDSRVMLQTVASLTDNKTAHLKNVSNGRGSAVN